MSSVTERPLTSPGHGRGLLDVFRRSFLLKLIVRKELRVRYRGSVLGMAWSYVKPLTQFIVFYLALGIFLRQGDRIPNFAIYLFSGIVVMNFFSESFGNGTRCLVWNAPLIKKIYLPREVFPVASLWVAAVHFFPQLVVLLAAALITGWRPSLLGLLAAVGGFLIVVVLALGLGLIFGAVNVFFRDSENFVDLIVMVATWGSPVLYSWGQVQDVLPAWLFWIYEANPLTAAVELFHYAFWHPGPAGFPEGTGLPPSILASTGIAVVLALALVLVGQAVFRRLEGRFAQEI